MLTNQYHTADIIDCQLAFSRHSISYCWYNRLSVDIHYYDSVRSWRYWMTELAAYWYNLSSVSSQYYDSVRSWRYWMTVLIVRLLTAYIILTAYKWSIYQNKQKITFIFFCRIERLIQKWNLTKRYITQDGNNMEICECCRSH